MLPVPFINLPYILIKLFRLIRIQDLPDARACLHMNCLELRLNLFLQIPRLLRGLVKNLTKLLRLRIGEIQYLLEMRHGMVSVKSSPVR